MNTSDIRPSSRGPLWPAVIAVCERYDPLHNRHMHTEYELTYPGMGSVLYPDRSQAEALARYYIARDKVHAEAESAKEDTVALGTALLYT